MGKVPHTMSKISPIPDECRLEEKPLSHLSAGKGFTQIKNEFLWPYWASLADCPSACRLWFWLLAHANRANCVFDATQQKLVKGTRMARRSVYQALTFLEERKFIVRENKHIYINELMTWKGFSPVNPYVAKAMAQPVIPEKRQKRIAAKKSKAA